MGFGHFSTTHIEVVWRYPGCLPGPAWVWPLVGSRNLQQRLVSPQVNGRVGSCFFWCHAYVGRLADCLSFGTCAARVAFCQAGVDPDGPQAKGNRLSSPIRLRPSHAGLNRGQDPQRPPVHGALGRYQMSRNCSGPGPAPRRPALRGRAAVQTLHEDSPQEYWPYRPAAAMGAESRTAAAPRGTASATSRPS